jgi:hypothetical protein
MAITRIYNQLQSIYNDLQSIYNRLKWQLQGFTFNNNSFTIDLQLITMAFARIYNHLQSIYNRLQWQLQGFTINYNPFTMIYNSINNRYGKQLQYHCNKIIGIVHNGLST